MPAVQSEVGKQATGRDDPRWYASGWVMIAAGYVLPPLGLYLMWRYRTWPVWTKSLATIGGLSLALVSSYLSSTYIMPQVF